MVVHQREFLEKNKTNKNNIALGVNAIAFGFKKQ